MRQHVYRFLEDGGYTCEPEMSAWDWLMEELPEPDPGPGVRPLFVIVTDKDEYFVGYRTSYYVGTDDELHRSWLGSGPRFSKDYTDAHVFEGKHRANECLRSLEKFHLPYEGKRAAVVGSSV